ncbi:MAG: hypothetical protein OHK0052_26220 [Anaerolineales bacterium]
MAKTAGYRYVLALIACLFITGSAFAQRASGKWVISPVETKNFPSITFFAAPYNAEGIFLRIPNAQNLTLYENDQNLPIDALETLRTGAQFAVALNPGPAFAIRNGQGVSRYDLLIQHLTAWAENSRATEDDLSLLTSNGNNLMHVNDHAVWLQTLRDYTPDIRNSTPNLDVLTRAINAAADNSVQTGMGKAVLFITPPLDAANAGSIQNFISLANAQNIRIHVWVIASESALTGSAVEPLEQLARQTGGQVFKFSGTQTLPDLDTLLEPLRQTYRITYTSQIRSSGSHSLRVELNTSTESISSTVQTFELNIRPAAVALLSPPAKIERRPPAANNATQTRATLQNILFPLEQPIQAYIEFPDGFPRPLTRSALYVNNHLHQENTAAPFDQFTLDLSEFNSSSTINLKIIIEDSLGLRGESISTPIEIVILRPTETIVTQVIGQAPLLLVIVGTLLAGSVFVWALVVGGKLSPARSSLTRSKKAPRRNDPVTQPVPIAATEPTRKNPPRRWLWKTRATIAPPIIAQLEHLDENHRSQSSLAIPIHAAEVTIGSDVSQATLVLQDPSIAGLHARLTRQADGYFYISDHNSIAGTWINYTPISSENVRLQHGDLLHIGRIGFRFSQHNPAAIRRIVIHPQETAQ